MARLYASAWERGVKTTYYLHVKPRHTAEQSTVRVNKSEAAPPRAVNPTAPVSSGAPRRGFGFARSTTTTSPAVPSNATAAPSNGLPAPTAAVATPAAVP